MVLQSANVGLGKTCQLSFCHRKSFIHSSLQRVLRLVDRFLDTHLGVITEELVYRSFWGGLTILKRAKIAEKQAKNRKDEAPGPSLSPADRGSRDILNRRQCGRKRDEMQNRIGESRAISVHITEQTRMERQEKLRGMID